MRNRRPPERRGAAGPYPEGAYRGIASVALTGETLRAPGDAAPPGTAARADHVGGAGAAAGCGAGAAAGCGVAGAAGTVGGTGAGGAADGSAAGEVGTIGSAGMLPSV